MPTEPQQFVGYARDTHSHTHVRSLVLRHTHAHTCSHSRSYSHSHTHARTCALTRTPTRTHTRTHVLANLLTELVPNTEWEQSKAESGRTRERRQHEWVRAREEAQRWAKRAHEGNESERVECEQRAWISFRCCCSLCATVVVVVLIVVAACSCS